MEDRPPARAAPRPLYRLCYLRRHGIHSDRPPPGSGPGNPPYPSPAPSGSAPPRPHSAGLRWAVPRSTLAPVGAPVWAVPAPQPAPLAQPGSPCPAQQGRAGGGASPGGIHRDHPGQARAGWAQWAGCAHPLATAGALEQRIPLHAGGYRLSHRPPREPAGNPGGPPRALPSGPHPGLGVGGCGPGPIAHRAGLCGGNPGPPEPADPGSGGGAGVGGAGSLRGGA
ncbi:hypothetical protein Mgrana_02535 [Meiothermus granaticius NBRC 107808]|uniref:Uncharacterized protein n=1 Tax=Meiothermus granaticius NBRC 107808 TaxID=1227551 RepID=A0A399F4I1_9DEIN|nr:hypothetical protein Mgrana_02535 [Meiothermus granaticius NBRC 107808]